MWKEDLQRMERNLTADGSAGNLEKFPAMSRLPGEQPKSNRIQLEKGMGRCPAADFTNAATNWSVLLVYVESGTGFGEPAGDCAQLSVAG